MQLLPFFVQHFELEDSEQLLPLLEQHHCYQCAQLLAVFDQLLESLQLLEQDLAVVVLLEFVKVPHVVVLKLAEMLIDDELLDHMEEAWVDMQLQVVAVLVSKKKLSRHPIL